MLLSQGFRSEINKDQYNRYLIVSIGAQHYAISLLSIKEVVDNQDMKIDWVLGSMMNLHGQVIPIVDARDLLDIEPMVNIDITYTIIVKHRQDLYGLIVDDLVNIRTILYNEISLFTDSLVYEINNRFDGIYSVNGEEILMLDIIGLLNE